MSDAARQEHADFAGGNKGDEDLDEEVRTRRYMYM